MNDRGHVSGMFRSGLKLEHASATLDYGSNFGLEVCYRFFALIGGQFGTLRGVVCSKVCSRLCSKKGPGVLLLARLHPKLRCGFAP